jgi:hypothetical protein
MAQKLDPKENVTFKELLIANAIQIDSLIQLLMEKGLITEDEYFTKMQHVQAEYRSRQGDQ